MDITRNQWFMGGLVFLLLGGQFRMIDSVVLTPEFTKFLAERTGHPVAAADNALGALVNIDAVPPKTLRPPDWFSWALVSVGAVLVLHALSMKRPD
ncbi:MAG: hypothetical protein HQ582_21210 [Planctomycetes bacterium]|nr:hypothetical protein [Planctomycetota bacterium]